MSKKKFEEEKKTVKYYMKIAIEKKDYNSLTSLLSKARKHRFSTADPVISEAKHTFDLLTKQEVESCKYYLKLGLSDKKVEVLKATLDRVDKLQEQNSVDFSLFKGVPEIIDQARELLGVKTKEKVSYLSQFIKQGLQLNNPDMLDEALKSAYAIGIRNFDQKLISNGRKTLDGLREVGGFLRLAAKASNWEALNTALEKARKLRMESSKEYKDASAVFKRLRKPSASKPKTKPKGVPSDQKLFGGALDKIIARDGVDIKLGSGSARVPRVCYECVEYLRTNGLTAEGLFRVPGRKDTMDELKQVFEAGGKVDFESVNDAAGVLKQFLRNMSAPLLPFAMYKDFVQVAANKGGVKALIPLIRNVPPENQALLCYLCQFIKQLCGFESVTRMGVNNYAIVFAPNILRPEVETQQSMMVDMPYTIDVMSLLIRDVATIWPDGPTVK